MVGDRVGAGEDLLVKSSQVKSSQATDMVGDRVGAGEDLLVEGGRVGVLKGEVAAELPNTGGARVGG
jgi:hypothetical protein